MKEIVIISGKGGTGKTMLSSSFAVLAQNKVLADCDVEKSNLHLLLNSEFDHQDKFFYGKDYYRVEAECLNCGKCKAVCKYEAINDDFDINPVICEECEACYYACPNKAIERLDKLAGYCVFSETKYGKLVYGELNPGENTSVQLVTKVKKEAWLIAKEQNAEYLIIDGPSGIGGPVNVALKNSQVAIVVAEPTLSGLYDLEKIVKLCQLFKTGIFMVINKSNLDPSNNLKIKQLCNELNIKIAGEIPYSEDVLNLNINGKNIIELFPDHNVSRQIKLIWQEVK